MKYCKFFFTDTPSLFCSGNSYPLRHSVSNHIPAVTMLRPRTAKPEFRRYTTSPFHMEYEIENDFIPSPSIPKIHMPHSALQNQVRRGWEDSHYVREMSVPNGRDSMKFSQWNDISPWNCYLYLFAIDKSVDQVKWIVIHYFVFVPNNSWPQYFVMLWFVFCSVSPH